MNRMYFGDHVTVFGEAGRLDISLVLVLLTGFYLVGLAALCIAAPERAVRFLQGFARSAGSHYLELGIRLVIGIAFVRYAPMMFLSAVFSVFGWILLITTIALFAVPWRWHRSFAERSVPQAVRYIKFVAAASFLFGAFIAASALYAVMR